MASVAAWLYTETAESRPKREHPKALRKANLLFVFTFMGRPTERDRTQLGKLNDVEDE